MAVSPVSLQPKFVFGLRSDIKGNIHFLENQEVVYPVAGVIAIHDYKRNKQTFLRLSENSVPTVIVISPNRQILAIAEWMESNKSCLINTYDVSSLKRKRTLILPKDVPTQNVESLRFTEDSRGLAVLSKEPDAFLTIFYFDKSETIIVGRVSNGNQPGLSTDVLACNLNDTGLVAVGGQYTFKLMSRQDKSFGMIGTISGEHKVITSLVWLSAEILVAGTSANQLLFIEGGDPKQNFVASTVHFIDLERAKDIDSDQPPFQLNSVSIRTQETDVNCLTNFESGFCYTQFNQLYVFEKEKSYTRFTRRSIIKIPIGVYPPESYKILNVSVSVQVDTVIVSTLHSQIYISKLMEPEATELQYLDFAILGEPLHIAGIIGMAICSWKPIFMTAADDFTVRVWNYETLKVELVKNYQFSINAIALHPTGLFVAIGFSDQLHLMEILLQTLKTVKTFGFASCNQIAFSHQGHLLACAYDNLITIVSVFSFEILKTLKGHRGEILSMAWSVDDTLLVSSGNEGAIYQWCVSTGERISEFVEKGIEFRSLAITQDNTIYVCTNSGMFREIHQADIVREIDPEHGSPLTQLSLSRSNLMFFMGSESGNLFNIQVPFLEAGGGMCTNSRFFSQAVSCMKITFDDRLLLVGSKDGSLVVWIIVNSEGKTAPMDDEHGKFFDIIVPRNELIEKLNKIDTLETRLNQLQTEHSFEFEHARKMQQIELQKICDKYEITINDLIEKQQCTDEKYHGELNIINAAIQEKNIEHSNQLVELEAKLCEKILTESNKLAALKTKMNNAKENYEKLLRKSADCLQETNEVLEKKFNEQLKSREYQIRNSLDEIQTKKEEFFHYCGELDLDQDRKMAQLSLKYEAHLNELTDELFKWRTNVSILTKKIDETSMSYTQLKNDTSVLIDENNQNKKHISQLEQNLSELQRELEVRNRLVDDKEACLKSALEKTYALEKLKHLFNERAIELEAQIQPLNETIKDYYNQIANLNKMKISLNQKIGASNIEIAGMNDRCKAIMNDLKAEQTKSSRLQTQINQMCTDIHEMVENIQKMPKIKEIALLMFQRYVITNRAMHQTKGESNIEKAASKRKLLKKSKAERIRSPKGRSKNLIKENLFLITKVNELTESNKELRQKIIHFESNAGTQTKTQN